MKVIVRDRQVLDSLQPLDVAAYLKARGWTEQVATGRPWTLFQSHDFEIALPLKKDLLDFSLRMAEVLAVLEQAEGRDQISIVEDLSMSSADVVRIRISNAETEDGTLRVQHAVEILSGAKDLMLAAACAAVDPKPFYTSHKPQLATDYVHGVRMGQTGHGSFVITLLARIPPHLIREPEQRQRGIPEPFERRVTDVLSTALESVERVCHEAISTGEIASFETAVSSGVSANLCAALATLIGVDDPPRSLSISLSWASSRQSQIARPSQFTISSDWSPVLREAARILQQKAPREEFERIPM